MSNYNLCEKAIQEAIKASEHSYSPYSHFPVGAAVLTDVGTIFSAPNIENSSYGLTLCAERNAIFHAVAAGQQKIELLVVYTPTKSIFTPCGACRQVLSEFASKEARVVCVTKTDERRSFAAAELLPNGFSL